MISTVTPSTQTNTNRGNSLTTTTSSSSNNVNFHDHCNAIISDHIISIQKSHLHRNNLNENEFRKVLHSLIQEFSPETLQSFQNSQSNIVEDKQPQQSDSDHLIQHLLQCNEQLAKDVRIQQENFANIRQHLLNQDDRLAAFIRFQQRQEQNNAHLSQHHINQNDRLTSIIRVQQEQQQDHASLQQYFLNQNEQLVQINRRQQEQELNHHFSEQLLQHVDQLTQLFINQQQQHARNIEALHQLVNRSFERNKSLETTIDQHLTSQDRQIPTEVCFVFICIDRTVSIHDSPILQLSVYPNYGFLPENIEVRCEIIEPSKYDNIYLSVKTDYVKPSGIILMVDNTINRCRTNKKEYINVNICNSSLILIYINHTILNDTLEKIDYVCSQGGVNALSSYRILSRK
ncbi:unnamed protein product [Rotaria sp. Silwood2]|nr:unnamed protein product [Rotaria sp. Silwood2]CAF2955273.1 unnamed protein product [Rotaria sp. Silwood2]CAF3910253.1 unnamed protein product [Rotaria sp. Silwood2]CAF4175988.1 unnamed protein product [Rotaria sp. Silwood2]